MTIARVFFPFALGYFLSFLVRVVNAVIAPDLISEMGLTAEQLGLLTSAYFFAFAAFQLPLGILLDKFGPRRTEAALLLFCALGAFLSATAGGMSSLVVGRALIGLGTSACLMAAFKAYTLWFAGERLPLVNGCQLVAGGLGALAGTVPIEMALSVTDWRGVFWVFGALAVAFSALIFFVVPTRGGTDNAPGSLAEQWRGVVEIFKSPIFWKVTPLTVMSQAAFLGVQSLWLGPWLKDVAGQAQGDVAHGLFIVAAAMIAGFFFIGFLAERFYRFGLKPMTVVIAGVLLFIVAQIGMAAELTDFTTLWLLTFGFFGTTGIVVYPIVAQDFAPALSGRVFTAMNLLVFVAAFAIQWGVGWIIDFWPTGPGGAYHPAGYQAAFVVIIVLQVAAYLWFAFYRIRREA